MINAIDNGYLSAAVDASARVREQLNTVTQQSSTGRVAETFGGLGATSRTPLDMAPQVAHAAAYQSGIDAASGRLDVAQTALSSLADIASTLKAHLAKLDGVNGQEVDSVAADARNALRQVAGLLNSKDGDIYVFAGQDTATPPVADADSVLASTFYTAINTAVGSLATSGASATAAATLAVASPVTPSGAVPTVETGPGQRVQVGVLASANTLATSSGPSTTGSYVHDLMRALATIGSLTSAQSFAAGFQALVQDTRTSLDGAIGAMATETGVLGNLQSGLMARKGEWAATQTALTSQVSSVEDVDMAATLTKLSALQTQLQSSYQVIAAVKGLTLASVL